MIVMDNNRYCVGNKHKLRSIEHPVCVSVGRARRRSVQDVDVPVVAEPVALGPRTAQGRRAVGRTANAQQPHTTKQVSLYYTLKY